MFTFELDVELLRLVVGDRPADPDARVVDQHVHPPEAVLVRLDDPLDVVLVAEVARRPTRPRSPRRELLAARFELVGTARRDGQPVALLAQHAGDRESDATRASRDQCGASAHALSSTSFSVC